MSARWDAVVGHSQFRAEPVCRVTPAPVEDVAKLVHESPDQVEMILLTAAEGG